MDKDKLQQVLTSFPGCDSALAVSGGPDSMALCWLLTQATSNNRTIHALTVDHGLRAESAKEAKQVGRWLKEICPSVKHIILTRKPSGKTRIMESARHDRYALMAEYCRKHGIKKLFVAHHSDDQAETLLLRLAKGSGLDGLTGMRTEQTYGDIIIVRPLLDASKPELIALCQENDIPFINDPSNQNQDFSRPRLRAALAREGMTTRHLATTARRLGQARDALEFYAHEAFKNSLMEQSAKRIVLRFDNLATQPDETKLRVLLHVFDLLSGNKGYGPRLDRLEALASGLFGNPDTFRRRTLGGFMISLDRKHNSIVVEREKDR